MKITVCRAAAALVLLLSTAAEAVRVPVYPQSFDAGGWSLDAQFMDVVGSPYLIAHGLGVRVLDAKARVEFPSRGEYRVWVRTKNWADGAPGRFRVRVDGKLLGREFGAGSHEWAWEDGGVVKIEKDAVEVALEDLTGFDGRCAGIVFVSKDEEAAAARKPAAPDIGAMMQPLPGTATLKDDGYFVWGGSVVKGGDGLYHLFYARWPKESGFQGWASHSEIAHAVAPSVSGPWTRKGAALPKRGAEFWDGMCTHNPCIRKFGGRYYLYYMGNTGDGKIVQGLNMKHRNNQRIGVAVADSPDGPWKRSDRPLVDVSPDKGAPDSLMTSNPAVTQRPDGTYLMVYKAVGRKGKLPFGGPVVHLAATSSSPTGPFAKNLTPIFTDGKSMFPAEDPCLFTLDGKVYAIVKDMGGHFTGYKGRSLVLFEEDGKGGWKLAGSPLVSGTTLRLASGGNKVLQHLERPQLYIEDGRPVALLCAAGEAGLEETYNVQIPLAPAPPGRPEGALKADDAEVAENVKADFVVVGGGLPGTCAAVAAARRGLKVVLVQDRPVLGGNASGEIRVWSAGEARYDIVRELRGLFMNRAANLSLDDARRMRIVQDEKNIDLRVSTRAFGVEKNPDGTIAAVKALDLGRNRVVRFEAPFFCDATGDGWVGFWAGADWRMGREAAREYGEKRAPKTADGDTLGASIMWTSANANAPVPFSAPWAEPHAQGVSAARGEWNWEYGIHLDMIEDAEHIRDRLLLAIYGAFSMAKKKPENANLKLDFCPYLLGKRESRRILGDWVLSEKDVSGKTAFEDAIASGSWGVDLHYDDFRRGVDFLTTCKAPMYGRYWIPYRCIYSRNVGNLFLAGRCFSCTHVGLGSPRVMNTLSQLGVAAGEAAALCLEKGTTPRGVYASGLVRTLQERLGGGFPGVPDRRTAGWRIVDDETPGVKFGKGWWVNFNENGEQVGDKAHFAGTGAGPAVYPLPVEKPGRYALMGRVPYNWWSRPGSKTAFDIVSGGRTIRFFADQAQNTGAWVKLGEFDLEKGTKLKIVPADSKPLSLAVDDATGALRAQDAKRGGCVVADGFALVEVRSAAAGK